MQISVIIPVYNAEDFIGQCVQSVLNQSFSDFELLLINDGSKDGSGAICDSYELKDSRVKVFHKENGGVSTARNLGLENATGDWVVFVDSDDTLKRDFLKEILRPTIANNKVGLVIQGIEQFKGENRSFLDPGAGLVKADEAIEIFETHNLNDMGYVAAKLYSNGIIKKNNLSFKIGLSNAEDLSFLLNYVPKAGMICFEQLYNYNYIVRENSLSTSKKHYSMFYNRYNTNKNDIKVHFASLFNNILNYNKLLRTLGIRLFSIFPELYSGNISKKERIEFLNQLDNFDKTILKTYSKQLNIIFRITFNLIEKGQNKLADQLLQLIFSIKTHKK